jgi:hypothetical protein
MGLFIVLEDLKRDAFEVLAKASTLQSGKSLIEMMTRCSSMLVVHAGKRSGISVN